MKYKHKLNNEDYTIVNQTGDQYYSISDDKYYYRVMTVYVTPEGIYGAFVYLHELV